MLADLRLQNGAFPSTPAAQVKGLWAYAVLPKWDASSRLSQRLNQDEIHGWARWWKKNLRWFRHGSVTKTYWMTLTVRSSLQNRLFAGFRHFLISSLGILLVKPRGMPSCAIFCPVRTSLLLSK